MFFVITLATGETFRVERNRVDSSLISKDNDISMKAHDVYKNTFYFNDELIGETSLPNGNYNWNKSGDLDIKIINKKYELEMVIFTLRFLGNSSQSSSYRKLG